MNFYGEAQELSNNFCSFIGAIWMELLEAAGQTWRADRFIVCSGEDFETLYPERFAASGLTRCKLQMLRTAPQPGGWELGPSLAAWLTLQFYPAFGVEPWECIKIGYTASDIAEGYNAGMWTVGVTRTENTVGLSLEDWLRLPEEVQKARLNAAAKTASGRRRCGGRVSGGVFAADWRDSGAGRAG